MDSAVFAQLTAECTYTLQWPTPSQLPLPMGDLDAHLIHGSLGPPSLQPKRYLDRLSRFCRAHYSDRPTNHATRSVTIAESTYVTQSTRLNFVDESVKTTIDIVINIVRPYVRSNNKIRVLYVFYDQ